MVDVGRGCEQIVSRTSAVDSPRASSLALACYKWLRGTAGGANESSGVDRLTDVSGFRPVRHRRNRFARVPRKKFSEVTPALVTPHTEAAHNRQREEGMMDQPTAEEAL